jgi:hypothetical protein
MNVVDPSRCDREINSPNGMLSKLENAETLILGMYILSMQEINETNKDASVAQVRRLLRVWWFSDDARAGQSFLDRYQ